MKTKFFIKNNLLFSDNVETIIIYKSFDDLKFEKTNSSILKSNKNIILDLNKFEKESLKEIKISGKIDNYKEVISNIKNIPKSSFKKISSEDYEFIEKTSQIDILDQIIESINNLEINELKERFENYLLHNQKDEKDKHEHYLDLIKTEENKIKIVDEKIKNLENSKVKDLKNKNKNSKKAIDDLLTKKNKLEEILGQSAEKEEIEKELEKLESKASKIKFNIEENKIDIKIIKTKINALNDSIKLGKEKTIQTIPFILSLGFVYWTKFSDTKYVRNSMHLKLNKKLENELVLEKKLHKIQNEIESKKSKSKKVLIKISKRQEQVNKEIEDSEIELKELEKENKKLEKKLDIELSEISRIEKEKQTFVDKKRESEMILDEYYKYSISNIEKKFLTLEKYRKENINNLKKIRKEILSQKIDKKGEWVVEV